MFRWWNSLRFRLCLLVTLGMVPLWVLAYYNYREHYVLTRSLVQERAVLTAGQVSMGMDLLVETTRQLLTSIALDPRVKKLDMITCNRIMEECYGKQLFMFYTSLGMIDPDGNLLCSSLPHRGQINLSDRDAFRKAVDSGEFSVGGFQIVRETGKSIITFGQPVLDDKGKVAAVLFAGLDLSWFNRIIAAADLPDQSVLTVIDHKGMVLSRNIDATEWIGKMAPEAEIVRACLTGRQGTIEAKGIDGVPKLYGFRPLGPTAGSGYVYVGVPSESVAALSRELVIRNLIWLLAALTIGFAAVWGLGLIFVTKKAAAIIRTSRKLASGDLTARTALTLRDGEIGELGCAFDQMAEVLERREREQSETAAGLLREKQFSDTLLESLPGIFYSFDDEGTIVRWNALLETVSGYSDEEISTMKSFQFLVEEDRPKVNEAIRQAFDTGVAMVEARLLTKEGKEIPCLFTGKRMEQEGRLLVVGMGIDISGWKKAEEDFRQSEATLRSILAASPVGIVVAENRKIKWVNQTWKEMFGVLDPQDYLAKDSRIFYPSDAEYERVGRELYGGLDKKTVTQTDAQSKKMDGTLFETNIRLCRIQSDSPSNQTVVITLADESEKRRAERSFQASERRFRDIIENVDLLALMLDREGNITFCNESLLINAGWSESEVLGRNWFDMFFSPERGEKLRSRYLQAISGEGGAIHSETKILTKNRQERLTKWTTTFLRDPDGDIKGSASIGEDITEIRLAEKEIEVSEERMRLLIEQSPIGIGIIQSGKFAYANPELLRILGYERAEEIVGRRMDEVMLPEDREFVAQRHGDITAGKETAGIHDMQGVRKNGEAFDAAVWPRLIDYQGAPSTLFFVADVTESRLLRAQLIQAQKMEAVGTLAGGIAHDFNNLLTIITGYTELLLQDKTAQDEDHGDLIKIYSAGIRGAELVQRLLAFSRKADCKPIPLNLNRRVESVRTLLERTIPKMIAIELNLADDLETIHADPTQLEQIIINLAVNAKDAMPAGGRLSISTRNVTPENDFSSAWPEAHAGKYVMLSVSDTGHGVDKETLLHIFEPFFTTKEQGKGTGLGLAMVYGIVQQHQGHIVCSSELGKGTTFQIYFPIWPTEADSKMPESESAPIGGKETILLVDDEPMIRELGEKLLKRAGYDVLTATNGREALEIYEIERDEISLVILDVIMPEMGGKECFEKLIKINPRIKVVVTSGYASSVTERHAEGFEAGEFVKKPFEARILLQTVRQVLDSE